MGYRKPTQAQRDAAQEKREGILANLADGIGRLADSDAVEALPGLPGQVPAVQLQQHDADPLPAPGRHAGGEL